MGNLFLLNDVETILDDDNLIVGDSDALLNKTGEEQSIVISTRIQQYLSKIDMIVYSPLSRLQKMVHHIRSKSAKGKIANIKIQTKDYLKERSFGVLTASQHCIDSDLFSHTRICAENGESVAQARDRVVKGISSLLEKQNNILVISHPFLCQIFFNSVLSKKHTLLTRFWLSKGSMACLEFSKGKFGFSWKFGSAVNLLQEKSYAIDEIYNEILSG